MSCWMISNERTTGKADILKYFKIYFTGKKLKTLVFVQLCLYQFRVNLQYGDSRTNRHIFGGGRIGEVDIEGFPSDLPQLPGGLYRDESKHKSFCHQHEMYVLHSWLNFLVPIFLSNSLCFLFNLRYRTIGECRPGLNVTCWCKSFFQYLSPMKGNTVNTSWYRYCKLGESIDFSYTLKCSCMYLIKEDSAIGPCPLMGYLAYRRLKSYKKYRWRCIRKI